jgi:hypothetical protein
MDGTVSCYSSDMETGIIMAVDGKRYVFSKAEWPRAFMSLPITHEGGSLAGKDSCDASSTRSSTSSDFEISEVGASCIGGLVASFPIVTGAYLNA